MEATPVRRRRRYEFVARRARLVYVFCWSVGLALGVAMALVPVSYDAIVVRTLGVAVAVAAAWFVFRSLRWATIDVDEDWVTIRGMFRTSRIASGDVERFELIDGLDESDQPATALAVRIRNVGMRVFPDFSSNFEGVTSVAKLVDQLNDWMAA